MESNEEKLLMPEPRANGLLAFISPSKYLLIGGSDRNKSYNDIWYLLTNEKKWEKIPNNNPISKTLTPRSGFAYCITNHNENEIEIYIHGGQDYFTNTFHSDLFKIIINIKNFSSSTIENLIKFPLDITKFPCARNSHQMVFDYDESNLYFFGGGMSTGLLNDLWKINIKNNNFEKVVINNLENVIKPRELFGMIYYKKNIIIFGGRLINDINGYSYKIDLENKTCKRGNKLPYKLAAFTYCLIKYLNKDYVIIYGGTDGEKFFNNFIVYDIENDLFKKSKIAINKELVGNDPQYEIFLGRISAMMVLDEKGENLILYGGSAMDKEWSYINNVNIKEIFEYLEEKI